MLELFGLVLCPVAHFVISLFIKSASLGKVRSGPRYERERFLLSSAEETAQIEGGYQCICPLSVPDAQKPWHKPWNNPQFRFVISSGFSQRGLRIKRVCNRVLGLRDRSLPAGASCLILCSERGSTVTFVQKRVA